MIVSIETQDTESVRILGFDRRKVVVVLVWLVLVLEVSLQALFWSSLVFFSCLRWILGQKRVDRGARSALECSVTPPRDGSGALTERRSR